MGGTNSEASPPGLAGAILSGGFSRRFGRDKAGVKLTGVPLALKVAHSLAAVVPETWLITNQPLRHAGFGLPLVIDLVPHQGPAGGLATALFYAPGPWVLVAAVDNPFLSAALLAELVRRAATTSRPAVVCRSPAGLEPFPGLFARRLRPRLQEFLRGDRSLSRFLATCRPEVLPVDHVRRLDPEFLSFYNLNTPRDLELAAARAQLAPPLDNRPGLEI